MTRLGCPCERRRTPGSSPTRRTCRRSPTAWTTSPASAGRCCARCPASRPAARWRPAPGDLGLQVLEWWAYLGDILTFYNERIANESYLRTAQLAGQRRRTSWRCSAISPRPAIAATGQRRRDTLRGPPGRAARRPGRLPAGEHSHRRRARRRRSRSTRPRASPARRACRSRSLPAARSPSAPTATAQSVLLAGPVSGIGAGDRLLLADSGFAGQDDNWSLVTVGSVTPAIRPRYWRGQHAARILRGHPGARARAATARPRPPTGCCARPARPRCGTAARPSAASRS